MIIELFGPPGSGKTTFARALAAQLRDDGAKVSLRLSQRPGERQAASGSQARHSAPRKMINLFHRVSQPVSEILAAARSARIDALRDDGAALFESLLAPGVSLGALRLRQYLWRLSSAWSRAIDSDAIAIFDQAYAQALVSALQANPGAADQRIRALLEAAPKSDLVIQVAAPATIIDARIGERHRKLGRLERKFEIDFGAATGSVEIAERVGRMLRQSGRDVVHVSSMNERALQEGLLMAERAIRDLLRQTGAAAGRNREFGRAS